MFQRPSVFDWFESWDVLRMPFRSVKTDSKMHSRLRTSPKRLKAEMQDYGPETRNLGCGG